MKKIWIQKALSLKSLAAQHWLQTAWCVVGFKNPDLRKHTDTELTHAPVHARDILLWSCRTHLGVYAWKIVYRICTKYLHTCASIDHWCTSYTYRCLTIHEVYMQAHQQACIWLPMHAQSAEDCAYSHTQHTHTCAHWLYAYEYSYFGRRREELYFLGLYSWEMSRNTSQWFPHYYIISCWDICDHFFFSWLPNTKAVRTYRGHVPVNLFCWDLSFFGMGFSVFWSSLFWMVSGLLMMGWKREERDFQPWYGGRESSMLKDLDSLNGSCYQW